ncbi:DNA translocase FtsK 4TM domain-containing protein [Lachnospiraceae bacterium LCP25S3_G4]
MATKSTKKKNSNTKKKITTGKSFLKDEIVILISLGFCIVLLVSNFGFGGTVGNAISNFTFGIFGLLAYMIPVFLFLGVAFIFSNKGNSHAYIKVGAGVLLSILFCTFIQLIMVPFEQTSAIMSYYTYSSTQKRGGGIIGGMMAKLLCPSLGIIGAFVIVVVFMIICIVLITEKSFLNSVKNGSTKAYSSAREDAKRRREQADLRREKKELQKQQQEQQRKNKQVSGVSFDTTLVKKSPEVHELSDPDMTPIDLPEKESSQAANTVPIVGSTSEPEIRKTQKTRKTKETTSIVEQEAATVEESIGQHTDSNDSYVFPPLSLLTKGKKDNSKSDASLHETAIKLQQTLKNFGVNVTVTNYSRGPSVTRYELQPEQGVKVSKIVGLADDIKLNLAAADIRIEAPIPGKAAVGIEVPNKDNTAVMLRDLLETEDFRNHTSNIAFAAGKDIAGKVVVTDIKKMPHLLIAGATGSGKSVCINTLIMSILYKASPVDVKLIMIDPKVVELSVYNGIPHLLIPVVTDPKKAAGALQWAVAEMTKRYQLFAEYNVRDLAGYNDKVKSIDGIEEDGKPERMPQIIIIVDELADLMMVAPGEVEGAICRLAQLARAAGIHLILATQRPSVNVITGLIKANMPSRIAFSVSSGVDSRTIIDMNGAEKLLGKGDMLFYPSGYQKPARVQGAFVSDKEVQKVVEYLAEHSGNSEYNEEVAAHVNHGVTSSEGESESGVPSNDRDSYFVEAGKFIIEKDKASISMLQRYFKIGYNRAARIIDQLAESGVIGEEEGTKPRKVLMSMEVFEQYIEDYI